MKDFILPINKPAGFTSFDVVAILRKKFEIKKVGHMGTLDPMATGVLPILFGRATKIQNFIENHDKKYIAQFKLGLETDTLDISGKIISEEKTNFKAEDILKILYKFKGKIEQTPPMFSAIKVGGKKLYELARSGKKIERKAREVEIKELKLLSFNESSQIAEISVFCTKGTYIRSLCADIGAALGTSATMTSLCRTFACGLSIEECANLAEVREKNIDEIKVYPIEYMFKNLKSIKITEAQAKRFQNGGGLALERLEFANFKENELVKIFLNNEFIDFGRANLEKQELTHI